MNRRAQAGALEFSALVVVFVLVYQFSNNAVLAGLASAGAWLVTMAVYNVIAWWRGSQRIDWKRAGDIFYWWP